MELEPVLFHEKNVEAAINLRMKIVNGFVKKQLYVFTKVIRKIKLPNLTSWRICSSKTIFLVISNIFTRKMGEEGGEGGGGGGRAFIGLI